MNTISKIEEIKETLTSYVGRRVHVTVKKGRKMRFARKGVIENVYPNIFVVRLEPRGEEGERRVSFSYADILTRVVEVLVFK
ncbi:MAG: Veg protein [Ruminococcaceae bacterium]|nr:Veg protein [Oscillospiraceae bacterium]